jgi:hypothetical protein
MAGNRPTGVTILGLLQILAGIAYIALGAFSGFTSGAAGLIVVLLGAFVLVTGLALFTGKNWSRILVMISGVLDLFAIPIGTIIGIIILYYFTRPNVKMYFGK